MNLTHCQVFHFFSLKFFQSSPKDIVYFLKLIWERQRGREIIGYSLFKTPTGSNLQTKYVPGLEIEPTAFQYTGQQSNKLSHLARAQVFHF